MTMHDDTEAVFGPDDDNFHALSDDWWETETAWFSFNVPERKMGGWFYGYIRPNIGISGGGFFVWDDTASTTWEIPYYKYNFAQPLPKERDLRNFEFPESYKIKMLRPLDRYELSYRDRKAVSIDVVHEAIMPPHPFRHGSPPFDKTPHFDQSGRIVGEMTLLGERIPIDCYSVRDRSWGPRIDHRSGRIGYSFATAGPRSSFCLFSRCTEAAPDGLEPVNHGYLLRDGRKAQIVKGWRRVERDRDRNWITRLEIDAEDEDGRSLLADGRVVSRLMLPTARGISCYSLLSWTLNGAQAWGEDQDVWRNDQWSNAQRKARAR